MALMDADEGGTTLGLDSDDQIRGTPLASVGFLASVAVDEGFKMKSRIVC